MWPSVSLVAGYIYTYACQYRIKLVYAPIIFDNRLL